MDFSKAFTDGNGNSLPTFPSKFHLVNPDASYTEAEPSGIYSLPAGTYTVSDVTWKGVDVSPSTASFDPKYGTPTFRLRIYDLAVQVVDQTGHAVESSQVIVFLNGQILSQGTTDGNGALSIHDLPVGQLIVIAKTSGQSAYGRTEVTLGSNTSAQVQLPLANGGYSVVSANAGWIILAIVLATGASSGIFVYKRVYKARKRKT